MLRVSVPWTEFPPDMNLPPAVDWYSTHWLSAPAENIHTQAVIHGHFMPPGFERFERPY